MSNQNPYWDDSKANDLVGATVILGVTYVRASGEFDGQIQMFGVIEVADASQGIAIMLEGSRSGETYWLPPDTRAFQKAPPGSYKLKSTNEIVEDPDFTCSFTITRASES